LIERSWEESGYPALTGAAGVIYFLFAIAAVRYVAVVSPFPMIVSELLLATAVPSPAAEA
jgi:hypothetical protein